MTPTDPMESVVNNTCYPLGTRTLYNRKREACLIFDVRLAQARDDFLGQENPNFCGVSRGKEPERVCKV